MKTASIIIAVGVGMLAFGGAEEASMMERPDPFSMLTPFGKVIPSMNGTASIGKLNDNTEVFLWVGKFESGLWYAIAYETGTVQENGTTKKGRLFYGPVNVDVSKIEGDVTLEKAMDKVRPAAWKAASEFSEQDRVQRIHYRINKCGISDIFANDKYWIDRKHHISLLSWLDARGDFRFVLAESDSGAIIFELEHDCSNNPIRREVISNFSAELIQRFLALGKQFGFSIISISELKMQLEGRNKASGKATSP